MVRKFLHRHLALVVACGASLVLGGCQSHQASGPRNPLAGTEWVLIEYKAPGAAAATAVPLNRYTLSLVKDGSARAKLDCNSGTTRWSATGASGQGSISFGPVAATRMLCPDGVVGERLAADLPRMTLWSLYDGRLTFRTASGGPEYVWDTID